MRSRARTARQIALFFAGCWTLATLALGIGAYWVGSRALNEQLEAQIAREVGSLERVFVAGGRSALLQLLQRRDDRGVNNLGYRLVDRDGRALGGELAIATPQSGWHQVRFRDPEGEAHPALARTIVLGDGSRLTVAAETAPTEALQRTVVLLFAGGFGVMLLVGFAGGLLFGRTIRARLEAMNETALAIIAGDLDQRVPVTGRGDEFDALATTLNRMLERTDRLVANLRQVSGDVAHDLRTPITRLRQRLELALFAATGDPRQSAEIESAIRETDAILSLFAAVLRIAEIESGALRRFFRPTNLSEIAALLAESYQPAAEDSGRKLTPDIEPDLWIEGDPELLAQSLVNLLENALRHTPNGTSIQLQVRAAGNEVQLAVEDDGPGVPAVALPQLTRRFTRVERARSAPGHGLGLNLVAAIAAAHGGELILANRLPGFRAEMTFLRLAPFPDHSE
jgi:signal transduction histidine kinase